MLFLCWTYWTFCKAFKCVSWKLFTINKMSFSPFKAFNLFSKNLYYKLISNKDETNNVPCNTFQYNFLLLVSLFLFHGSIISVIGS